ncbi:putative multi-sensor hybrid histidine kinase [Sulfurimonas gotlandica GD1]|uniref:Putative multi-sensor hybrid histidine kinase n=1 Tax=Sulfurimonas gotlandica (strain DSM 19862 / JCM 16533 / GD1) TaxID=929558 RepID=B6BP30_SULGG|nr:hypothetical protein [Sulfurimonas gotlandica]EDZ61140.1 hypothetical protein CBGD1_2356 [Sulfurimonas gotlandica GD1]EHP30920.1 putative multi-sensor hybrid histidine kinase [Sulfurimonas gotlandica GD1]
MFEKILKNINLIKDNKEIILDAWIGYKAVQNALKKNDFDIYFYRENFASKVFDYAIGVVESKNKLGECPVIGVMLMLFKKKNIPLSDVFIICVHLKNALLCFANDNTKLDNELISQISELMDFNFEGVIDEYIALYYHDQYINRPNSSNKVEMPTNLKVNKNSSSAIEYLSEIDVENEFIEELDELEYNTLNTLDAKKFITQKAIQDSSKLFARYAKILNRMYDFEELSYTLTILSDLLSKSERSQMNDEMQGYIQTYLKAIINDLRSWRMSIFITKDAQDVHYLDKTLLSSISQLQMTLMPSDDNLEDEIEFF